MISDLHMDYDYTPGMNNDCGKPLCCRSDSGLPASPEHAAGKWGDFKCDTTVHTLKSLFEHITDEIKPDMVFWGGDSIPHNLDSLTFETNVHIMKNVTKDVAEGLSTFKIYPTIGNHDTYPQDDIKMTKPRSNPAINEWAPTWNQFIEDDKQYKTWLDYGYFSLPLTTKNGTKLGKTETRVISLNSNICYDLNFESMTAFNDPGDQLGWLEDQLLELEKVNG
jgi:sphingomyelin phosphodiesterase